MSDPFVAEVRIFPFNFPPTGWAFANGQLLPISQNTAVFALVGTYYGGDGKSTFALPDMRGNALIQQGQGSGLSERFQGEQSGTQTVTLLLSEIPVHNHGLFACDADATTDLPSAQLPAKGLWDAGTSAGLIGAYSDQNPANAPMHPQALSVAGASLPHNNMQPYLALNYCIALQGVFPQRP